MTQSTTEKPSRGRSKRDLPQKLCANCNRPFAWRKKWARDWDGVRFCSKRCRRAKPSRPGSGP